MAILPPDPLFCLKSDMGYVHNMCFISREPHATDLVAATESGFVYFWNLETNRIRNKHKVGTSLQAVHCLDDSLLTQEKNGLVKLWQTHNETDYELLNKYECNGGYCRSILVDNYVAVPQSDSGFDVVKIETLERVRTFKPEANLGYVMALQKVDLNFAVYILAGYETGDVILWDFKSGRKCSNLKLRECITSLTFDSSNGRGVCGNSSNALQVFAIGKDLNMSLKCEISITNEGCNVVKIRPDYKIFVSGGWDGRLRLFSWKSLRALVVLTEHAKSVTDVQFSPNVIQAWNSNVMAASGSDGVISLWNLYNN